VSTSLIVTVINKLLFLLAHM